MFEPEPEPVNQILLTVVVPAGRILLCSYATTYLNTVSVLFL